MRAASDRGFPPHQEVFMTDDTTSLTRRQVLKAGGVTFAGYAMAPDRALADAITTDTQVLRDSQAATDFAKTRPGVRADRVGVTGWCWGGSTTIQIAGTLPDIKAAAAWYGPPARPYPGKNGPVTGFDVAKDIKVPFLGLYGEKDQNPKPEDVQRFAAMLKEHNKNVDIVMFPA